MSRTNPSQISAENSENATIPRNTPIAMSETVRGRGVSVVLAVGIENG